MISSAVIIHQQFLYAYMPGNIMHPDTPGYHSENNTNLQNITPIPFTPADLSTSTTDDQANQQEIIGYFWDSKDTDNTLRYPGKARIGNDQYINVVAVDSKNIDTSEDLDAATSTGKNNIMDPSQQNNKFKPEDLVKLGTFMRKNDQVIYYIYGQYLSTIVPDPTTVETL